MTTARSSPAVAPQAVHYRLMLFVAGDEPNSRTARQNLADLCEQQLAGRCDVEIVDVLEDFAAAARHNVLVTPTLLVVEPAPEIVVVGNLSDRRKVCAALRLGSE